MFKFAVLVFGKQIGAETARMLMWFQSHLVIMLFFKANFCCFKCALYSDAVAQIQGLLYFIICFACMCWHTCIKVWGNFFFIRRNLLVLHNCNPTTAVFWCRFRLWTTCLSIIWFLVLWCAIVAWSKICLTLSSFWARTKYRTSMTRQNEGFAVLCIETLSTAR